MLSITLICTLQSVSHCKEGLKTLRAAQAFQIVNRVSKNSLRGSKTAFSSNLSGFDDSNGRSFTHIRIQ